MNMDQQPRPGHDRSRGRAERQRNLERGRGRRGEEELGGVEEGETIIRKYYVRKIYPK